MMLQTIIVSAITSTLAALTFTFGHNYLYERRIAVVDINQLIQEHVEFIAKQNISDSDKDSKSEEYKATLTQAMAYIEKDEQVTLLVKPAVLSSVADYTDVIRNILEGTDDDY